MARRDVVEAVGPAPSAPDFSRAVRKAGLRCVCVPQIALTRTAGRLDLPQDAAGTDPYFNPNLDPRSPVPRPRED
jgi:hypothetical protein